MPPRLVVQCGLPGVGKSTVARAIADRLDGERIRSDAVRREVVDDPTYSRAEKERVYGALLERAREALADGRPVVLDATFERRARRDDAAALAEAVGADLTLVRVVCDDEVARRRIRDREDDPSEADVSVYENALDRFEPPERDHVTVDNSGDLATTRRQVDVLF
ncbi:AAA family ATPase [Halosimplex litoreum]|uniref:AAA family ATPase n=1 Tax=Halosimplex litoreum TaxID=1198301 RepID=A0A7T3FVS6_9EURY|nr:AAA family ATPase [Halosimplex litoreum]QPV61417.1 AAA family ATPase [Halosimplex litoreum]